MWSLPDINRLNEEASINANKYELALKTGKIDDEVIVCECGSWGFENECDGEIHYYLWYDIFSDDSKGVFGLCEKHDGYYGSPTEGFFICDGCGKVHTENYTWENYHVHNDWGIVCLNCYRENELSQEENWINLTNESIESIDFDVVRKAKHLLAVGQNSPDDLPDGLIYIDNAEFDSMDGHSISGNGLTGIKEALFEAKEQGHTKAILILDAAYQFAVSIGVYVKSEV